MDNISAVPGFDSNRRGLKRRDSEGRVVGPSQSQLRQEERKKARVTVVETAYYETFDGTPSATHSSSFHRRLGGSEQSYGPRFFDAHEGWQPLDLGWVKECCMLFLVNRGETVVEVSFAPEDPRPDILIHPGESARLCPTDPTSMKIRSGAKCRCSIQVFPA